MHINLIPFLQESSNSHNEPDQSQWSFTFWKSSHTRWWSVTVRRYLIASCCSGVDYSVVGVWIRYDDQNQNSTVMGDEGVSFTVLWDAVYTHHAITDTEMLSCLRAILVIAISWLWFHITFVMRSLIMAILLRSVLNSSIYISWKEIATYILLIIFCNIIIKGTNKDISHETS